MPPNEHPEPLSLVIHAPQRHDADYAGAPVDQYAANDDVPIDAAPTGMFIAPQKSNKRSGEEKKERDRINLTSTYKVYVPRKIGKIKSFPNHHYCKGCAEMLPCYVDISKSKKYMSGKFGFVY